MLMKTLAKNDLNLVELSKLCQSRLAQLYAYYFHNIPSLELKKAMEYSLFNGGKHLRPLLIYATGSIFNASLENLDIPASSVELIHTYSLIHDDLPCMDNADLRRGKPSCHKVYGEGMTVLTGDALHTLAMQIIATQPAPLKAEKRIQMLGVLSRACGPFGMAAGQALDITMMSDPILSTELLTNIYRLKTGALFSACIELGWLASTDEDEVNHRALLQFGEGIGLAFQIQDDILDIEVETTLLGKTQGIDSINNKMTYPKLVGLDQAKNKVQDLYEEALASIDYLGSGAQLLRELIDKMLNRKK
jgi:farnesyl diphosphate synthase